MFTHKDIEMRTIFVVNCIKDRNLRVSSGELLLEDTEERKTLTKLPFQKILALFVVGHIQVTTPLIDKCRKHNVALVVMKPNLRPVFYWSVAAEGNYLLRQKQFAFDKNDLTIAKGLMMNKTMNQLRLLEKTRQLNELIDVAKKQCKDAINLIPSIAQYDVLMGIEGAVAKHFFAAYFQQHDWKGRKPRAKTDPINATLDIGYTVLFNFIECFVRMFGFDVYVGVYHRLWFKRKSLICDLMEPFRCLIENQVRTAFNKKQCSSADFTIIRNEYRLRIDKNSDYSKMFFEALIPHKVAIFKYIQSYYRCFMQGKQTLDYPQFLI